ncbi:hypothetical protein NBO_155g0001 [Nosema bombycis CQ1]|uniref:Uncharacterized protein n=1 Tax=Nosema bombycis (strain CQ1 / CVCC 102059) TaxID=578461 RepID=R0MK32_NOSB1|nr:hypothetical protein NBO_155g0001 [Nosema bombycis CQ1]|eukprot:EOB13148.1 hypothetical protein NBO_155g0001 [Nosema bombycis CQ1]
MNKALKTIAMALIGVQYFIILFELGTCTLNMIIGKTNFEISNSFLSEENSVKILSNLRQNQIYRCICLFLKTSLSIFFIIFVDSLDFLFKKKIISDNIEISYVDEIITLDKEFDMKEQADNNTQSENFIAEQENNEIQFEDFIAEQENDNIERDKLAKSNFLLKLMINFSGFIISLLQSEENILLWLSHLYIYTMYIEYLFNIKTALAILIFPYFYKKLNLNLYLRYRYNKPLIFLVFIVLFKSILSFISHFTKKLKFIRRDELPDEIQNYFNNRNNYVLIALESSDKLNLELYSIYKFVYVHLIGDIDKLTAGEQMALFERQIRNNKVRFKVLIIKLISFIVTIVSQVLFIRYGRGLFVKNFTKIGEYFVGYMVLNISMFIILNFICNYFYHKIEYDLDFNTTDLNKNEDLASVLCKQAVFNNEYVSFTRLFGIFYDQTPSFIKRCKRLMSKN